MPKLLGRFLGSGASTAIGVSVGGAGGAVLTPAVQDLLNKAWNTHQSMPLEPVLLAAGVAQGQVEAQWAADESTLRGVNGDRFAKLVAIFNAGPGVGEAFRLWRRNAIDDAGFERALKREGIEPEWIAALLTTKWERLSAAEVAAAVQQGHLPNPGILPDVSTAVVPAEGAVPPLTPDGQPPSSVPLTQIALDPFAEAAAHGVDADRLRVLANLAGLPPGAHELLDLWNRGEIDEETVDAGLREGHLKTKWAGAFKRFRWAVLGASEYANAHIRGWVDRETMYRGGALTGHTKSQMDLLYLNRGRPVAPVQAFNLWAREAPHPNEEGQSAPGGSFDHDDFADAIRRSDIQTRYIEPLWALRWAYPPLFQLVRLATAGAFPEDRFRAILKKERYEPVDIDHLADFAYRHTAGAATNPFVSKAQGQLYTAIHKAFAGGSISREQADAALSILVPDDGNRGFVLELWTNETNVGATPRA